MNDKKTSNLETNAPDEQAKSDATKTISSEQLISLQKKQASQENLPQCGFLHVMEGEISKKQFPLLKRENVIGRDPSVDICFPHESVSKRHAVIQKDVDGNYIIHDLKSTNGTKLNGQFLALPTQLKDGDLITFGIGITVKFLPPGNQEIRYFSQLVDSVNRDPMLQIYNKKYLLEFMNEEIKKAQKLRKAFSLMVVDLDFFKKVNDTYGHDAGDYVLKETAKVLTAQIRSEDVLGRYGGEEFVLVLPHTDQIKAMDVAERIRKNIQQHEYVYQKTKIAVTASIGVATSFPMEAQALEVFKRADKALYESKKNGRNRVTSASTLL